MRNRRADGRRRLLTFGLAAVLVLAPVITVAPSAAIVTALTPYALPAACVLGGVLAVLLLALAFGGRPRSGGEPVRR